MPLRQIARLTDCCISNELPLTVNRTLAIDAGGSFLKLGVTDERDKPLGPRTVHQTQTPCAPYELLAQLTPLAEQLRPYDRISVGFPGMVRNGVVLSAPLFWGPRGSRATSHLIKQWRDFPFRAEAESRFDVPVRLVNDSVLHAAATITGQGVEVVVTLGTGIGTTFAQNGSVGVHMEFAHHQLADGCTYNEWIGDATLQRIGPERWIERVQQAVTTLDELVFFDALYIGGGNARLLSPFDDRRIQLIDPLTATYGGARLWELEIASV